MRFDFSLAALCLSAASLAACTGQSGSTPPTGNGVLGGAAGFATLHSFQGGADGDNPRADLTAMDGKVYGTTFSGGTSGKGTVFEIDASGNERVAYSFAGGEDGEYPDAGLVAANGVLYGTTKHGGDAACDCGTVFELHADGTHRVLHRFDGFDGAYPQANLIEFDGALYGTAFKGGPHGRDASSGTVFELKGGAFKVLHRFAGYPSDGAQPKGGLVALGHTLYGTTTIGGNGACPLGEHNGCGAVFAIDPSGNERLVYGFQRGGDPWYPDAGLTVMGAHLYGTATSGGAQGRGAIFAVDPVGTIRVLYSFTGGSDGKDPGSALTAYEGTLYGTTPFGALGERGTVFGFDGTSYHLLHTFTRQGGEYPEAGLLAANGVLYGTTSFGGDKGRGTIFSIAP
jgi:uncharacterized repeat protein (TIGR03803 family)